VSGRAFAVGLALVCCGWSPARAPASAPWRIAEPVRRAVPSCAAIEPRVICSGESGLTLEVRMEGGAERPCRVGITAASLQLSDRTIAAARLPKAPALTSAHVVVLDVPFHFEPPREDSHAVLVLGMTVDGETVPALRWPLDQALEVPSRP
jgi:hypothetical protein